MSALKDFNTFRGGSSDAQSSSTEALLHNGMRLGSPHKNEEECGFESVMLPEHVSEDTAPLPQPAQYLADEDYALLMDDIDIKEEKIPDESSDEEPHNLEAIAGEKLIPQVAASIGRDPLKSEADEKWIPQTVVPDTGPQVQDDAGAHFQGDVVPTGHQTQSSTLHKCQWCPASFVNEETLKSHSCTHSSLNVSITQPTTTLCTRYQCLKCKKLFISLDTLKAHACNEFLNLRELAPNQVQSITFLCSTCRISFKSLDNFKKHVCKCDALKCKNCHRIFINPFYLKNHIKVCHMRPINNSILTKRQATTTFQEAEIRTQLLGQQIGEKKEKRYTCKICKIKMSSKAEAEKHMISAHCQSSDSDEELSCDICHLTCTNQRQLDEHLKLHKTTFSCTICDFICYSIADLSDHNKIHELACSEPKFSCDICDFICDSRDELVSHDATHINSPQDSTFTCNTCDFVAYSMIELQQHKKLHLAESLFQYPCQFCGVSFINEDDLKVHVKEKHSEDNQLGQHVSDVKDSDIDDDSDSNNSDCDDSDEDYQPDSTDSEGNYFMCYLCDKEFVSRATLRQHQSKLHLSVAKDKSKHPQEASDISVHKYLQGRQRLHNDIFLCSHCNIEFTSSNLLYFHAEKFHSDIKMKLQNKKKLGKSGPNKCDECPSSFKSSSVLRLHKLLHRGIKAFPCRYCGKQYAFNNAVIKHYKKIHPENREKGNVKRKSISCRYCDRIFSDEKERHDHYLRNHSAHSKKMLPQRKLQPLKRSDIKTFERKSSWFDYFECNHCLQRFPTDSKLFLHGEIKHKDIFVRFKSRSSGPFPCEECGATCESMKQLRQHVMRHRGIKAYHCNYCPWKTFSVSGLKTHVIKSHVQEYKKFQEEKAKKKNEKLCSKELVVLSDEDSNTSNNDECNNENESHNVDLSSESNSQMESFAENQNEQRKRHENEEVRKDNEEVATQKRRKLQENNSDFYSGEAESQNFEVAENTDDCANQTEDLSADVVNTDQNKENLLEEDAGDSSGSEWENEKGNDSCSQETESSDIGKEDETQSQNVESRFRRKSRWFDYYECNHCLQRFSNSVKLFVHGQQHHKDIFVTVKAKSSGSLPCEECNATCDTKQQLREHMMRHRGIKAYHCNYCTHKTTSSNGLRTHVKKAHEKEYFKVVRAGSHKIKSKEVVESSDENSNAENMSDGSQVKNREEKPDSTETQFQDYEIDKAKSAWFDYYECNHCQERFFSSTKLFIHGQMKHKNISIQFKSKSKGPLKCDECRASCMNMAQLRDHVMHHRGIKAYQCKYCTKKGYTAHSLKVHVMRSHKKEYENLKKNKVEKLKFQNGDGTNTEEITSPATMVENVTRSNNEAMTVSAGTVQSPKYSDRHTREVFFCSHCKLKFKTSIKLLEHAQKHHSDIQCTVAVSPNEKQEGFLCNECSASFSNKSLLRSHILLHRGIKAYVCRFCGKTYACRLALEMHYQAKHPNGEIDPTKILSKAPYEKNGNFKCDVCKLGFETVEILARHKLRHIENFRCKYCNKGFPRSSARWAHYVKCPAKQREADKNNTVYVEKEKPNTEHEVIDATEEIYIKFCSKKGRQAGNVFLCNYCSKGFKCSSHLFYHAQKLHSDVQVKLKRVIKRGSKKCDECPSTFKTLSDLRLHKVLHRGITPYPCKYCDVAFSSKSGALGHMTSKHPDGKNMKTSLVRFQKQSIQIGCLECNVCKEGYKNKETLQQHQLSHTNEDSNTSQFKHEKKMSDSGSTSKVNECLQTSKQLGSPRCSSKWIDSYECNHCDLEFTTLGQLFQHAQEMHQDKSKRATRENSGEQKCDECRSSFANIFHLRQHILEHRGVLAYKCRHCQYRISTLTRLKLHLRKQHLQQYINVKRDSKQSKHLNVKNTCQERAQVFATPVLLKWHVAKHRKRHVWCKKCWKHCNSVTALKQHMLMNHNSKKQILCAICDMQLPTKASLGYHMWKLHNLFKPKVAKMKITNNLKQNFEPQNVSHCKSNSTDMLRRSSRLQQTIQKVATNEKPKETYQVEKTDFSKTSKAKLDNKPKQKNEATVMLIRKNEQKMRKCNLCDAQFYGKAKLFKHKKYAHNITVFYCDVCSEMYLNKKTLLSHLKWHFPSPYKCQHCQKSYEKKYQLRTHICLNADGKTFACKECNRTFNTSDLLLSHRRTKHIFVDTQCTCNDCGATAKNKIGLRNHMKRYHLAHPYLCSICGATFPLQAAMKLHAKRHEEEKWQCPHCPRKFLTSRDYYQHRNMIHLKRCHVCNICGRAIKAKQHFDYHMARHKYKVKAFPCPHCGKAYATLTARKYHLRVAHAIQ